MMIPSNIRSKKCSVCGHILKSNEGIEVGYVESKRLPWTLYLYNCSCNGTLSEKRMKYNKYFLYRDLRARNIILVSLFVTAMIAQMLIKGNVL